MIAQEGTAPQVAALVLAAGGASRMGELKQLLPVGGQPMVRRVTETVCAARLAQVVVVVGAQAEAVRSALGSLPVDMVANEAWAKGLSSSLRAGLNALRPEIQAALVVLADQPALTPGLLQTLVERYRSTGAPVVAPFYRGRRGNPVLWDRSLFPELLVVAGDQGGRALLSRYETTMERVDLDDPAITLDVDTPQDYQNLLESSKSPRDPSPEGGEPTSSPLGERAGARGDLRGRIMTADRATRRATLLVATLVSFLTPFMGSATNVAMPSIGREFGMDAVLLGWVPTVYLLAAAIFLVPFGRLADIYGRKRIFAYGTTLFTVGSLLTGLASSTTMLLAARVVQGIGSSMIFGTGVAILTSVFEPGERGRVLGLNVAAVYIGGSVGPFVGGLLTENLGWRSIFWLMAPLGLIVIVFVVWKLKGEWAEAHGESFDLPGSTIYALALVALMYGFSQLPELLGGGLILLGLLGLGAFAAWELRARNPVLNVRLLVSNRPFALSNLAALLNYSANAAVSFLLSLYLQYIQALTPQQAGVVLIAQPIVQASFSPVAGWLSDRIEPRIVASIGMGLTAAGLALFIPIGPATPLWTIIARLALLGLGFALFSSPNMNAIMSSVARRLYGIASGMLGTMRLVGQMLSLGIATLLFALYIGRVEITPELYPQFLTSAQTAFAIFAALCVLGIFASLARGKIREIGDW